MTRIENRLMLLFIEMKHNQPKITLTMRSPGDIPRRTPTGEAGAPG
jgi:hypothetical protein